MRGTQCIVVLEAVIYSREKTQNKLSKGKRHMGQSLKESRHKLLSLPLEVTQDTLNNKSDVTACVKSYLPEKLLRGSVPRAFIGGWSHRHPLPNIDTKTPDSQRESRCSA